MLYTVIEKYNTFVLLGFALYSFTNISRNPPKSFFRRKLQEKKNIKAWQEKGVLTKKLLYAGE